MSDEDQAASLEAGFDAFLPKPIDWPRLAALLERFLKLEWIYEEDQAEDLTKDETAQDIIAPPQEELEHLLELALREICEVFENGRYISKHWMCASSLC